jgi:hypothetical protein
MKRVACIGTKEISPEEHNLLIKIGGWLALQDFTVSVSSGNAAGSERFFALALRERVNRVNYVYRYT